MLNKKKTIKLITHRWQIKLYLFIFACLLWFFVVNNQVYETVMKVPIVATKVKPRKIVVSDFPPEAEVRFSGKGKDLLVLKHIQQPYLELDLHTINYFFDFPLAPNMVVLPTGLNVTVQSVIEPETVKVILEDEQSVRVPVLPNVIVHPQAGYTTVGMVNTVPESVTVSGPKNLIRQLRGVVTEERNFDNVKKSIEESIPVMVSDPDRMDVSPHSVRLTFEIDKIAERRIEPVPVGAVRIPRGRRVTVEPSTIKVVLRGPAKRLSTLTADSIDAYINIEKWNPKQKSYPPEFNLPLGLELVSVTPKLLRVRVEVR